MKIDPAISPGDLPLYVRAQGSDRMLQAGPSYRIGRDPESDIVVEDARVSWHHAVLRLERDFWLLEDSGSTNGTFVGLDRVRQIPITGNCLVRLGHPEDGPAVSCSLGRSPAGGRGETAVADPPAASQAQPAQAQPVQAQPVQAQPAQAAQAQPAQA
ncbi:MAG: FHA domain-containing protein, partial [Streptosporangiaceae bacterium]